MPGTQEEQQYRTATFDENGNDTDTVETEVDETEADVEPDAEPAAAGKYRIGDREFATMEEAHAYATSQLSTLEAEKQMADAYRLGIQDAQAHVPAQQSVTPPAEPQSDFDEQLYYENPAEFLKQYARKISENVTSTITQKLSEKELSDQLWNQFAARHPELADYRDEVESAAGKHLTELKVVNATKGISAGFDFVALKVKSNFQRYANAVKPARQLANTRQATAPGGTSSVTPKPKAQKPLSFAEQIRSIKPKRR